VGPFSIEEVLAAEAAAIHDLTDAKTMQRVDKLGKLASPQSVQTQRSDKDADERSGHDEPQEWVDHRKAFYCELGKLGRAALCFSGGGIRSATFCLGVIQALAKHKVGGAFTNDELSVIDEHDVAENANQSLLSRFHYLSTVSGGGYIGSWLSAWRTKDDFPTVWQSLATRPDGPDVEPAEISWLRAYSSYLTPKVGIGSADTWSGVAIYLRNLILNWLIIVPAVAFILLLLKFIITLSVDAARIRDLWWPALLAALIAIALLVLAQAFVTRHRPTRRLMPMSDPSYDPNNVYEMTFVLKALIPSLLSALFMTAALTSFTGAELAGKMAAHSAIGIGAVIAVVIFAGG
jgi:hypothetical protein